MAYIRKHRGKYQVQIRRKGFSSISKSFVLLSDAKEWATLQERKADRGELGPDRKELENITLADLVTRYRNEVVPSKQGAEIETIVLDAFLRHRICKKRLSDLTTSDFATYRDERLKVISPQTLKRQLAPISNMFEVARIDWKLPLPQNPLAELSLKAKENKRDRRLREGELDRLLKAGGKTRNPFILPVIRFALETAMRRGEILSLRVRDVDIERCTATIRESKNGYSRTNHKGHVDEPLPSRDIREVRKPEHVWRGSLEVAVYAVERTRGSLVRYGGFDGLAANDALKTHYPHEPCDGAAGNLKALPLQLSPDFPHAIDLEVLVEHPAYLNLHGHVATGAGRQAVHVRALGNDLIIRRRGNRQQSADRLDPEP